ncbi:MAG: cell division protein FtsQ/DivIB [Roseburia sp.]
MMLREQRKRKKRRKIWLILFLSLLLMLAIGVLVVWKVFTVEKVIVEGNELYSSEQIENLVLNDEYSWNSLYVNLKYRFVDTGEVPFVDAVEVSMSNPHTLRIRVYEKGILGSFYISSIGQNAYFDKDGFVVETSVEDISDVPKITGVSCDSVVLYERLPLSDDSLLTRLLGLTRTLKKYELLPQEISYDDKLQPILIYDNIRVIVGSDTYLEQKIVRLSGILPKLSGKTGTLHLETWTPDMRDIIFDDQS